MRIEYCITVTNVTESAQESVTVLGEQCVRRPITSASALALNVSLSTSFGHAYLLHVLFIFVLYSILSYLHWSPLECVDTPRDASVSPAAGVNALVTRRPGASVNDTVGTDIWKDAGTPANTEAREMDRTESGIEFIS